jgi:Suppressor of fused protein (SUFU)
VSANNKDLVGHLESHLGAIIEGWSEAEKGSQPPFQVVRFEDQPMKGTATFTTLGLSNVILGQHSKSSIRLELVFCCYDRFITWDIPKLLTSIGNQILLSKEAYMRGQVLGPAGPLFKDCSLEALYCARPVYFPETFQEYQSTNPSTFFVWLIPITKREATYVGLEGWSQFEDILVEKNPDLLDLERESVVT